MHYTRVAASGSPTRGSMYTSIEPGDEINDVRVWDGTGLIVTAMETNHLCGHRGLARRASELVLLPRDHHQRMEEEAAPFDDDYQQSLSPERSSRGLDDNPIGTNMLRAYMHGFFVDGPASGRQGEGHRRALLLRGVQAEEGG